MVFYLQRAEEASIQEKLQAYTEKQRNARDKESKYPHHYKVCFNNMHKEMKAMVAKPPKILLVVYNLPIDQHYFQTKLTMYAS